MENNAPINSETKINADLNQKIEKVEKEVQPVLYEQILDKTVIDKEQENDINSKILKITMKIRDQYPELSKYIEEMEETIPDEKNPEITEKKLKTYYDSLNAMLNKYILEHSGNGKQQ